MKRNKPWMDSDQYIEDYYEEMLYRQALEYEWEQRELEQIKNEKGRIHVEPQKVQHDNTDQCFKLPF